MGFIIIPEIYTDKRGNFFEVLRENRLGVNFVQTNQSMSYRNVLRGLHFQQSPFAIDKLVRCVQGNILDIAVDIRKYSNT